MAQERMDDWWEYAKELAKAERELQIGHWVRISIEYRDEAGDTVRLHSYDLPRELHERYRWDGPLARSPAAMPVPSQAYSHLLQLLRQTHRTPDRFQLLPVEIVNGKGTDYHRGKEREGVSGIPAHKQPVLR